MLPEKWAQEGEMEREKGIVLWKYHIDSHSVLLLDHYSEVVTADDLSWSRA